MQECFINVYSGNHLGLEYYTREEADKYKSILQPLLYRLHVKLKPVVSCEDKSSRS